MERRRRELTRYAIPLHAQDLVARYLLHADDEPCARFRADIGAHADSSETVMHQNFDVLCGCFSSILAVSWNSLEER